MGHKRKRSLDCSPLSISSFGSVRTPEAQSPTPIPNNYDGAMDVDCSEQRGGGVGWDFASVGRVKGADWGLRTRKRVRDNRPDERVIHENTINKLFSAQRKHPHAEPIMSDELPSQQHANPPPKPQKSTLHSFWNLPAPPVQPPSAQTQRYQTVAAPHCEDCDALLQKEADGMDIDIEFDGPMERTFACGDCGRNVCGTCAVVSNTRHCLQCATSARNSRRWW